MSRRQVPAGLDRGEEVPVPAPGAGSSTRRRVLIAGVACASIAVMLLLLGPSSFNTWMSQRSQKASLDAKISALDSANDSLDKRARALEDPETVKAIARTDYGMVPEGSKAYAIVPSAVDREALGGMWPFVELSRTDPKPPGSTTP